MKYSDLSSEKKFKMLHRIVTENYDDLDRLLKNYLDMGTKLFDVQVGIASHIENETYSVVAVSKNPLGIESGAEFELENTYCREVVKSNATVSVIDAGNTNPFKSHPVYQNLQLETYISAPIYVNEKIYGTLNFSSQTKREKEFSETDYEVIEIMAGSVGRFVEKKIVKDELRKSQAQAMLNSRLSSIGVLAGGMAHEINNPLTILKMSLHQLEKLDYENPKKLKKSMEAFSKRMVKHIDRIEKVVRDLTQFSGKSVLNSSTSVNLNNFFQTLNTIFAEQFEAHSIKFECDVAEDINWNTDGSILSQVFINLISNSIDATMDSIKPKIKISAKFKDGDLKIAVEDNGPGIKETDQQKIFEPFFTLKDTKHQGLGLSVARGLVSQIGGTIEVSSKPGKTKFLVNFSTEQGFAKAS